ncbi:MAG TPA: DMT family transporter [Acidimicrobiales bacterium]|nr:DMT family transporter [Acidimicrobiales bacterium]
MSQLTWGIVFAVLSVTVYASGMVLEKAATRRLPPVHARQGVHMIRVLSRDPLWLTGFALLLLGLGFQVLALTSAPISIVQTVAACGIALFLVLSHFVLGDRLTKIEYLGIATMLVALLLLGLSVDANDELVIRSTSLAAILAVGIPALAVGVSLFLVTDQLKGNSGLASRFRAPLFGLSSGLLYGVAALGVKEVSTIVKRYGLTAGTGHILISPGFYLFVVSTALGFLVFQTALQRTTASVFVPVNNATSSGYFIVAGTLLFHEHLPNGGTHLAFRLGAFASILAGLLILAIGKKDDVVSTDAVLVPEAATGL